MKPICMWGYFLQKNSFINKNKSRHYDGFFYCSITVALILGIPVLSFSS